VTLRFAGADPDLATATTAVHRSAASLGATLTAGDIALERAGAAAARLDHTSTRRASPMIWRSGPFEPIAITYSGGHETATIDEFRDELGETLLVMRVHQGS
jgi:hypothetical protein